jgi:hypothetical protein
MNIDESCSRQYHASRSSGTRSPKVVEWIVIHDEEASTAESAARYFSNPAPPPPEGNGPAGSAHLCVDDEHCFRTLDNTEIPWGASSSFGANTYGFHIEQAGYGRWPTAVWRSHFRQLRRVAYKTALHCHYFNIPPYFVGRDGLLAGRRGVTTHREITYASKKQDPAHAWKYDHTDPGLFWPRFYFMRLVRQYYAELNV